MAQTKTPTQIHEELSSILQTIESVKGKKYADMVSVFWNTSNALKLALWMVCGSIPKAEREDNLNKISLMVSAGYMHLLRAAYSGYNEEQLGNLMESVLKDVDVFRAKQDEYNETH